LLSIKSELPDNSYWSSFLILSKTGSTTAYFDTFYMFYFGVSGSGLSVTLQQGWYKPEF